MSLASSSRAFLDPKAAQGSPIGGTSGVCSRVSSFMSFDSPDGYAERQSCTRHARVAVVRSWAQVSFGT